MGDLGAIVVGAGHNGLICAAYLAKAGVSTVVVEARDRVGGCASSEVVLGGASVNICNCDHSMIRATPIAEELGLASYGLNYLDVEPSYAAQHWDGGDGWFLFNDIDRTIESLRYSYPAEVQNYQQYLRDALPMARMIVELGNSVPTPGSVLSASIRHATSAAKAFPSIVKWSRRSVGDVVRSYFATPQVQSPVVTAGPSVWGLPPDRAGTGLGALGYAMRHVTRVGRPVGGSGALTDAISAAFVASGGTLRLGSRVTSVLCDNTGVRGVALVDRSGATEELSAPIVVIATDPRVAMVEWFGEVPSAAKAMIDKYRSMPVSDGYESKVDAIVSEAYRPRAVPDAMLAALGITAKESVLPTMVVSSSLAQLGADHELQSRGVVADRPQLFLQLPTVLDPSVGSALGGGRHVFSLEVLWTPYDLAGGWEGSGEPERWLRTIDPLVDTESGRPFHETVEQWRFMGPREYEQQFFMHRGHAVAYSGTPISAFLGHDREQSRYRTPLPGLFLTGAATFPGAGIWGASGRNAAAVVLSQQ